MSRAFQDAATALYLDGREGEAMRHLAATVPGCEQPGTLQRWMSGTAVPSREIQRAVITFASKRA